MLGNRNELVTFIVSNSEINNDFTVSQVLRYIHSHLTDIKKHNNVERFYKEYNNLFIIL